MKDCKHCNEKVVVIFRRNGPHFTAYCKQCGHFICNVPHNDVEEKDIKQNTNKKLF